MSIMQKQELNVNENQNDENELDIAFIADESKQPVSQQILSFSEDRSVSGISFLNTPNYTAFSINDPQLSCLQSWPQQSIQPFKVCPKRNASIRQQSDSYQQQQESHEKYTKKRINQKMKVVDIKQVIGQRRYGGYQQSYNSYCLRKKKKEVSYNENSSEQQESERNQLRFLVAEIKERPITRSFKKLQSQKEHRVD